MTADGFREMPEAKTCATCDWWCYGTWPGNTCDRWETTLFEIEVPDDVIARLMGEPTAEDMETLRREVDELEKGE